MEIRCPNCGTSFKKGNGEAFAKVEGLNGVGYLVPETIRNENKGDNKVNKRDERIAKLEAAGFDVSKFTTMFGHMDLETVLNGCFKDDPIAEQIYANGYVKNTKLHRRWIMAQTFRLLGDDMDWTKHLKRYAYSYTFDMMVEEVRVLSKLEASDKETYEERSKFFTKGVVVNTCLDYVDKMRKYICSHKQLENKKYGKYYKTNGRYYRLDDLNSYCAEIRGYINEYISSCKTYSELYSALKKFLRTSYYIKLNWRTTKYSEWVDAFKGAGCYYTLQNLIRFHNCSLHDDENNPLSRENSLKKLANCLEEYQGYWWRMLALLKDTIQYNNFSFRKVMAEKYGTTLL